MSNYRRPVKKSGRNERIVIDGRATAGDWLFTGSQEYIDTGDGAAVEGFIDDANLEVTVSITDYEPSPLPKDRHTSVECGTDTKAVVYFRGYRPPSAGRLTLLFSNHPGTPFEGFFGG